MRPPFSRTNSNFSMPQKKGMGLMSMSLVVEKISCAWKSLNSPGSLTATGKQGLRGSSSSSSSVCFLTESLLDVVLPFFISFLDSDAFISSLLVSYLDVFGISFTGSSIRGEDLRLLGITFFGTTTSSTLGISSLLSSSSYVFSAYTTCYVSTG